ncbi:hypothetical protein PPYR_07679 [Photinus pyralis]|uniref:Uncharacterized protein n=1 Tax=Photinus pyralis TaxID=7054 RepID=A0A5N4AR64_PHOPY|nr:hypothetical protein PPYR_07679 [Photinus pyralis]
MYTSMELKQSGGLARIIPVGRANRIWRFGHNVFVDGIYVFINGAKEVRDAVYSLVGLRKVEDKDAMVSLMRPKESLGRGRVIFVFGPILKFRVGTRCIHCLVQNKVEGRDTMCSSMGP